jgi:hypothetical protein
MAVNMNVTPSDISGGILTVTPTSSTLYTFNSTVPASSYQYTGTVPNVSFFDSNLLFLSLPPKGTYNFIVDALASGGSTVFESTTSLPQYFAIHSSVVYFTSNSQIYTYTLGTGNVAPTVFAGSGGTSTFIPGTGTGATIPSPRYICFDSNNSVFYFTLGRMVAKMTTAGVVTAFAGSFSAFGYLDGPGASALFGLPLGVDVDSLGNVYVADRANSYIRKITPAGVVSTLAGSGVYGYLDSPNGLLAQFNLIEDLTVNRSTGDIYTVERNNYVIRKVTSIGSVSTIAGSNSILGYADGTGSNARFGTQLAITFNELDSCLYTTDVTNRRIRKTTLGGLVSTLAGDGTADVPAQGPSLTVSANALYDVGVDPATGTLYANIAGGLTVVFAKFTNPIEVRPLGTRPPGSTIVATTNTVTVQAPTQIIPVVTNPTIVNGVATLYKYSPFQYIFSNTVAGESFTVSAPPELASFVSIDSGAGTASFSSLTGFQSSYSSVFPITFNALVGSNVTDTFTFNVQVLPGRFLTPPSGFSNTLFLNEPITPILYQSDVSLTQIYSAPSLPPGLSFVQVDASGTQFQLQGTPSVPSAATAYNIVGRNIQTGRVVSVSNVYRVGTERIVLNLSGGSSNVINMTVGTPIATRLVTASYPTYGTYSFQYRWTQVLPTNLQLTDVVGTPVVSGFSPTDASSTIELRGTPSLALAQFLSTTSNSYPFTLTANLSRGGSNLTASIPFTFSFGETVLFTKSQSNLTLYVGDTITSNDGYFFDAQTYFATSPVGISNIFSPDLRSDLSLTYAGGSSSYLSGQATYSAASQPFIVRAVNSNGIARDTIVNIATQPDIVTFASVDLCSTFIFSRPVSTAKPGYYNSPIVFRATATSGNTITYDDGGTLTGTGLSLSNAPNNSVRLVGSPTALRPLTNLTVTATAAETGGTGTTTVQFSIVPDSATWTVTPTTSNEFIQGVPTIPYQFTATTLSELPVSYYSASGLPLGLTLSSRGRLTGAPTVFGAGIATITANTGYSALSTTFAYNVLKDAVLFLTPQSSYSFLPGDTIPPIQITALSYTGSVGSNFAFSSGDHISYGVTVNSNGVVSGTFINESPPTILYPRQPIEYTSTVTAGDISDTVPFALSTDGASRLRTVACVYDSGTCNSTLYYTERAPQVAGVTTVPAGTYWYEATQVSNATPICLLTVGDNSLNGMASENALTNVYFDNGFGMRNEYTFDGRNYTGVNTGNVGGNIGVRVTSAIKNYGTATEVYGIGVWYNFVTKTRVVPNAYYVVSVDNGLTFNNSFAIPIDYNYILDATNFYPSSNAPNGEGLVISCVTDASLNSLIVGGAADASGNHSILYGTPQVSIYNTVWDSVTNEFSNITTDIRTHYRWMDLSAQYQNVYFLGSDTYDPYEASWTYTGAPTSTIKYAPITGYVASNVLSNAPSGFNVAGLKFYGFTEPKSGLWATGISYSSGFFPELRKLSTNGVDWDVVDLSTSPLFTPSPTKPSSNIGYGPIFFSGIDSSDIATYVVVRRNGTTETYVQRTPTSPWVREADVTPFSNVEVPIFPDTGMVTQFTSPVLSLDFTNQSGPDFPAQETHYLLYQYAPTAITIVPPTPELTFPYMYIRDQDLPQGLVFDPLTGTIGGYPTLITAEQAVPVYALQRGSRLVSQYTIYITVVNPFIVRPQMSAAAYTSLLRQYTLANATQNARDNRVYAGAERNQGAFAAGEGTDVTTAVVPRCDDKCL